MFPQHPLCTEDLEKLYRQIKEGEERDRKLMHEYALAMQKRRKKDPRRFDAEMQAALEIFGRIGDPVNPIIAHPKTVAQYKSRVEELLG